MLLVSFVAAVALYSGLYAIAPNIFLIRANSAVDAFPNRLRVELLDSVTLERFDPAPDDAVKGTRAVDFDGGATETTIYERSRLPVGAQFTGPAIIEQFDATTVVPAGWAATVDTYLNLIVRREG